MKAVLLITVTAVTLVVGTSMAGAATTPNLGKCLDTTGHSSFRLGKVTDNLGLAAEVDEAARDRIGSYGSARGFEGLDGIGLTAEQIAEIMRRINVIVAANSWPIGWPCQPFKNRTKVIKEVQALLIHNGFRPAMKFYVRSPRQLGLEAIQDGIRYFGTVVKTAPRQIFVSIKSIDAGGTSARVSLKFDA